MCLWAPSPADGPLTPVLSTELDQLRASHRQHEIALQQAVTDKAQLQAQLHTMQTSLAEAQGKVAQLQRNSTTTRPRR